VLKELMANGTIQVTTAETYKGRYPAGANISPATVPLLRRWLGDEAIQEIWYDHNRKAISEAELHRLARIFPEAEVREVLYPPCHPGCFPRGTLVETPHGKRSIEDIQPGDFVTTIFANGVTETANVQSVFVTENRLWKVVTEVGAFFTTETQPLCLAGDTIKPAGELQPRDRILRRLNGAIQSVEVQSVSPTPRIEKVFNLILGDSEIFVAGGYLVRSKPPAAIALR
jgi:hypothetical protein